MQYDNQQNINSWARFEKIIRASEGELLAKLDNFHDAILVAGCQRSGTTALSRLITASDGMVNFAFGKDDELDAALILSGYINHPNIGRYCFQTTYLNDSYPEYFSHSGYKLIWVIRQPLSVVYSMLYNWKRAALNRLFNRCGSLLLDERKKKQYEKFGVLAVTRLTRSCLSYNAKVEQIIEINKRLDRDQLMVIDYDQLVQKKDRMLPEIYNFIGLPYKEEYAGKIHSKSIGKSKQFPARKANFIEEICMPRYREAKKLLSYEGN